jgi:YidC/Oxa1 family membrane protein insertase
VVTWGHRSGADEASGLMGYFEVFAAALAGFYALVPSYGLAIVLLTLATRVLLLPLSIKQTRSMREMARIAPEVQKLRAKYKGDRQKMTEAQMALYKEHGVNPLGGCGPVVLQMPVLFGLFYVIREPLKYMGYKAVDVGGGALEFQRQQVEGFLARIQDSALANGLFNDPLGVHSFLGLRLDCSASLALQGDSTPILSQVCGTGLLSALPYIVLVLAMGFTTYYQQKQMQATQQAQAATASPQMQQTQMMMTRFLPAMLMVFSFTFPSGLVVYWLATNLWTIVQQRIILRAVPLELGAEAGKKPASGRAAGNSKSPAKSPVGNRSNSKKKPTGSPGGGVKKPAAATPGARPASKKKKKR